MIALFAAPLLAAAGMAYANVPPACVTGVDCGGYRPANPNIVFAQETRRDYPVIGGNPATWTPQPPVIGRNPATWGPPPGYAYEQGGYAQQGYGPAYAQQAYGEAQYATQSYTGQGYAAQGYVAQGYIAPAPQAYAPAPQPYAYGQASYGYGYQPCGTCQAYVPPPPPPPVYNPCCQPAPQFQEVNVRADVYSGGVGVTDIEGGGGGGGGNGNFEVFGYGNISNFVSANQQVWANATANAKSSANAYANASNSVNIDISNNFKWGGKGGHKKTGCDTCGYTPPPSNGCDTCSSGSGGGVGMGGWGGGHKSGWGGSTGCNTCGGSSSGGSKMGGWGGRHR